MRYALLALIFAGCIFSPEHKTIHEDYSVDPACLHYDSTTWTDTTETTNMSCASGWRHGLPKTN